MAIFRYLAICVLAVLYTSDLGAQTTKQTVILYNNEPVRVDLSSSGDILKFYETIPNYLIDYNGGLSQPNTGNIYPEEVLRYATISDSDTQTEPELTTEIAVAQPETQQPEPEKKEIKNEAMSFTHSSASLVRLEFRPNFAVLDQEASIKLDKVARSMQQKEHKKVVITVFKSLADHDLLLYNRLNSTKSYLALKGVPKSAMITEISDNPDLKNSLIINFLD